MDFTVSEDQTALAEGIRALCEGRFPLIELRKAEGSARVVDRAMWDALEEAGVFSLAVPEGSGGLGLGLAHSAVVFEELGRALIPGPLVATALARWLELDARGMVGMARSEPGSPILVEHLGSLDSVVLDDGKGLALLDPARLEAKAVKRSLDPLTPMWMLQRLPRCEPSGDRSRWRLGQEILTGALAVGCAAATLRMAVEHAKRRRQFGKAIGEFQAVKHLCADMLVRYEIAQAAVHAAALTVDQPGVGDPHRAAPGAALLACEAALANARSCIQVHGGIGFTWEVPAHLYLMRARVLASSLGPLDELARQVADHYTEGAP